MLGTTFALLANGNAEQPILLSLLLTRHLVTIHFVAGFLF